MFDPFNDFETAGYLRNNFKEKDLLKIKKIEHDAFSENLPDALRYLSSKKIITYNDFLKIHEILFSDFYPWAGQDRLTTSPNIAISKSDTTFANPQDIKMAINEGLRLGQMKMSKSPGVVMGMFAFGHPFLDGNGRTMLLVHMELCQRAGFSISWANTNKKDYLDSLSKEIDTPDMRILDDYLLNFINPLTFSLTNLLG